MFLASIFLRAARPMTFWRTSDKVGSHRHSSGGRTAWMCRGQQRFRYIIRAMPKVFPICLAHGCPATRWKSACDSMKPSWLGMNSKATTNGRYPVRRSCIGALDSDNEAYEWVLTASWVDSAYASRPDEHSASLFLPLDRTGIGQPTNRRVASPVRGAFVGCGARSGVACHPTLQWP